MTSPGDYSTQTLACVTAKPTQCLMSSCHVRPSAHLPNTGQSLAVVTLAPTHRHKAGWVRGLTDPSGCLCLLWPWVQLGPGAQTGCGCPGSVPHLSEGLLRPACFLLQPGPRAANPWEALGAYKLHRCRALLRRFSNQTSLVFPNQNLF